MRLISSIIFLVGALSVGAYAYFPSTVPYDLRPLNVVEIEVADNRAPGGSPAAIPRSFAPDRSAFRAVSGRVQIAQSSDTGTRRAPEPPPAAVVAPGAWRAVTTTMDASGPSRPRIGAPAPHSAAHYELVRNLQSELRRVGCYVGEIDSDWGVGSRRAAEQFLAKVNATLPTESPDYILLTLIQGHVDKACGVDCPSGQGLAADGRCVPNAIVAQGPERGSLLGRKTIGRAVDAWQTTTATVVTKAPVITKAPAAPTVVAKAAPATPSPTVAARPAPVAAAKQVDAATPAPAIAPVQPIETAPRATPSSGRMAIGAPVPADAEAIATAATETRGLAGVQFDALVPVPVRAPRADGLLNPSLRPGTTTTAALATPPPVAEDVASHDASATLPAATSVVGVPSDTAGSPRSETPRKPKTARPYYDRPSPSPRAERTRYADRDSGTVRTTQGKVRRGSPTHNLMLSLGGVY